MTGRPAWLVRNGVSKTLFSPQGPRLAERPTDHVRVLVEGPLGVPMKAVDETIDVCLDAGVTDLWHVSPQEGLTSDRATRVFSRVPIQQMSHVYRSVDLLVKLSRVEGMFGPPLEAFHCGATALVSEVTGYDEFMRNGVNGLTVPVDDFAAATVSLESLLRSPDEMLSLRAGAQRTALEWPSLEASSADFASVCVSTVAGLCRSTLDRDGLRETKERIHELSQSHSDPRDVLPDFMRFS